MYPFRTRETLPMLPYREKSLQNRKSRRADSNRGPLHYEERTSEGARPPARAPTGTLSLELERSLVTQRTPVPVHPQAGVPVLYPSESQGFPTNTG